MNGSAASTTAPTYLAHKFCHDLSTWNTFGERVPMTPVRARNVIVGPNGRGCPRRLQRVGYSYQPKIRRSDRNVVAQ